MGLEAEISHRVADALAVITDLRLATALERFLVTPRRCQLVWDYGHPHSEFPGPIYPGFVIAEFPESGTGIAYSEYGFGALGSPWGLIDLETPGYGMDCGWFLTLEGAFRDSCAWNEPPPQGYEVE